MVIDLPAKEAIDVLILLERTANKTADEYWHKLAVKVKIQIETQINGGFFQCSACTDLRPKKC